MDGANILTAVIAAAPGTAAGVVVLLKFSRFAFDVGKWMGSVDTKLDHLHECVERLKKEDL